MRKAACEVSVTARQLRQRIVGFQRFGVEYVEAGVADVTALERGDQRRLVDQRAAGGIDQDDAGLHLRDAFRRQEAARFVAERQMQRDDVGLLEQGIEIDQRHRASGRGVRL